MKKHFSIANKKLVIDLAQNYALAMYGVAKATTEFKIAEQIDSKGINLKALRGQIDSLREIKEEARISLAAFVNSI